MNKRKTTFDIGINKEWLITNGIGGYANSTIYGCNTRKYHGLLIASLEPPAKRYLILSKLDESIEFNGNKYNFYTNICKNNISNGYEYMIDFDNEYIPRFTYKIKDVTIEKTICMKYGKNIVCVLYKIKNGNHNSKLILAPVLNFRNTHTINLNHKFDIQEEIDGRKVKAIIDNQSKFPIYFKASDGKYIKHENDIFRSMYYIEEEKRGLEAEEDLIVPGRYEIEIKENEEKKIEFICSLNEKITYIKAENVIKAEVLRLRKVFLDSKLYKEGDTKEHIEQIQQYINSTDKFIAYRSSTKLHTIIAGFPWFIDWGRDSLIALEGITLIPHRFDIAREVILTLTNNIKDGLIPNGYSDENNLPLYNSVDAPLLVFEQINKYIKYTMDFEFVEKIYEKLQIIIAKYINGINLDQNNIYLDDDFLISSGTINTQNTWMDVKYDGFAITPRNGKAVEINAMWYNALKTMENLAKRYEGKIKAKQFFNLANRCKKSFLEKFYNENKKCLYDVLGDGRVRPNQLFALSLTYPIINIDSKITNKIISTVEKKLLTQYGLRTLAKDEPNYVEIYEGDSFRRDLSYHQGPVWPWLLGLYFDALRNILKYGNEEQKVKANKKIAKLKRYTEKTFSKKMYSDGIMGSISEIYDTKEPYLGKGATAQAWSVAEIYRIIFLN